jgi:hypothetical protein
MPNAADIQLESRLFALFVGCYDAGKSTAAASFPDQKYFLDFDGRIVSLRGRKDVDYDSFQSAKTGFAEADKALTLLQAYCCKFPPKYSLVCFDSLSMGRRNLLYDAMKFTGGKEGAKKDKGRQIGELWLPTVQDYGYESEALWQIVYDGLKPLKSHVVVTAHTVPKFVTRQKSENAPVERVQEGEEIYGDPKLVSVLPILFTEIYYFSKKVDPTGAVRRFVRFDGDVARTTYPQLSAIKEIEITDKSFYEEWSKLISQKGS